ncbi:MAG: DUF1800 domain-containing protein [Bacteroidota bacterium]
MNTKQFQHLHARAGFGISKSLHHNLSKKQDRFNVVNDLLSASDPITELKVDISEFENLTLQDFRDKATRQKIQKQSRMKMLDFNKKWIERLSNTNEVLREKMTLFWANHFVCRDNLNVIHINQYNNKLRKNALGNFGDFVKAVSKEASMLKYLNTKQNRKKEPNENFARELMELFTLGEGQYSETDVKEAARAFTGYNHDLRGNFKFRKFQHDAGKKDFLGKSGNFKGDDIIDIILEQRQCARFVCEKIYSYFVNDNVNYDHIEEISEVFYKDYNIENLMRYIFSSDWFYDDNNIGVKIKSPIEFLVGMRNIVPITFQNRKDLLKIQKLLGQVLLFPPNVAGWKGGKNWIDANTMMLRLKLPSVILSNAKISIQEKGEFEDSYEKYYTTKKRKQFVKADVDWEQFDKTFEGTAFDELKDIILATNLSKGAKDYISGLNQNSKRNFCVQLMSLPEYQMC